MLKKFKDESLGVPGGYFLREDGTAMDALGRTVPVRSDAELQREYPVYRPRGGSQAPPRPAAAPVVTESVAPVIEP